MYLRTYMRCNYCLTHFIINMRDLSNTLSKQSFFAIVDVVLHCRWSGTCTAKVPTFLRKIKTAKMH